MAKATERKLPHLPDQGASDLEFRDWLTVGVGCPSGVRFEDFIRYGDDLSDACMFTLSMPGGEIMAFRTTQKLLSQTTTIRTTLAYATNGILRVRSDLSKPELEDIWIALITLSNIIDTASEADETWSWLGRFERVCDVIEGVSFVAKRRFDALLVLQRRPTWGRVQALADKPAEPGSRPVWIVDAETREQYLRVSELLTFLRHQVGAGPIRSQTLTSRIREIGGDRVYYEIRDPVDRGLHPRASLFLLPAQGGETAK